MAGTGTTGTTEMKQEAKDENAGRIGMAEDDDDAMTEATAAMAVLVTPPVPKASSLLTPKTNAEGDEHEMRRGITNVSRRKS